jgi:hypothetical protein
MSGDEDADSQSEKVEKLCLGILPQARCDVKSINNFALPPPSFTVPHDVHMSALMLPLKMTTA